MSFPDSFESASGFSSVPLDPAEALVPHMRAEEFRRDGHAAIDWIAGITGLLLRTVPWPLRFSRERLRPSFL